MCFDPTLLGAQIAGEKSGAFLSLSFSFSFFFFAFSFFFPFSPFRLVSPLRHMVSELV